MNDMSIVSPIQSPNIKEGNREGVRRTLARGDKTCAYIRSILEQEEKGEGETEIKGESVLDLKKREEGEKWLIKTGTASGNIFQILEGKRIFLGEFQIQKNLGKYTAHMSGGTLGTIHTPGCSSIGELIRYLEELDKKDDPKDESAEPLVSDLEGVRFTSYPLDENNNFKLNLVIEEISYNLECHIVKDRKGFHISINTENGRIKNKLRFDDRKQINALYKFIRRISHIMNSRSGESQEIRNYMETMRENT